MAKDERSIVHRSKRKIAEVVLVPALLAGFALEWLLPASVPWLTPMARAILAVLLIGGGAAAIWWARRTLAAEGQSPEPGRPTTRLVTSGPYALSRNPVYAGAVCCSLGVALVLDAPWMVASSLLGAAVLHMWMVLPEEAALSRLFGAEYDAYRKTVRRWL